MADNASFFHDTREPMFVSNLAAITLATTLKALYTASNFPVIGGQYFARPGKKVKIRLFGSLSTGLTPGNGVWSVLYGTGADANGVVLASSAAHALIASQTNISFEVEVTIRCITTGNTGTLEVTGRVIYNAAVVATFVQMIPASAAAPSAACDLTAALILSIQFSRSGSTAETIAITDLDIHALN